MSLIKFSDNAHWYRPDGQEAHDATLREARKQNLYRSVTTIDKDVFPNHFLDKWKMDELAEACANNARMPHENVEEYANRCYEISLTKARDAANFGKALHTCMDKYPAVPADPELLPWFLEFDKWYKENVIETVASEKVMLDHQLGVAGRCDKIIIHKTLGRCLLDYKTQGVKKDEKGRKKPAFYDAWCRQLSFYDVCDAKDNGLFPAISGCISLVIDSGEPGPLFVKEWAQDEIKGHYRRFVAGSWIYYSQKNYWPVGRWDLNPSFPMPI